MKNSTNLVFITAEYDLLIFIFFRIIYPLIEKVPGGGFIAPPMFASLYYLGDMSLEDSESDKSHIFNFSTCNLLLTIAMYCLNDQIPYLLEICTSVAFMKYLYDKKKQYITSENINTYDSNYINEVDDLYFLTYLAYKIGIIRLAKEITVKEVLPHVQPTIKPNNITKVENNITQNVPRDSIPVFKICSAIINVSIFCGLLWFSGLLMPFIVNAISCNVILNFKKLFLSSSYIGKFSKYYVAEAIVLLTAAFCTLCSVAYLGVKYSKSSNSFNAQNNKIKEVSNAKTYPAATHHSNHHPA